LMWVGFWDVKQNIT